MSETAPPAFGKLVVDPPSLAATHDALLAGLRLFFAGRQEIELVVLIGSRTSGKNREDSDWDFAIQWQKNIPWLETLGKTETLRRELAVFLQTAPDKIDLVDLPNARLAMRAVVANEDVELKGDNTLPWSRFLLRTWRELEDYYWDKQYYECTNGCSVETGQG
jgi:predicted nucleotidyltransferase